MVQDTQLVTLQDRNMSVSVSCHFHFGYVTLLSKRQDSLFNSMDMVCLNNVKMHCKFGINNNINITSVYVQNTHY